MKISPTIDERKNSYPIIEYIENTEIDGGQKFSYPYLFWALNNHFPIKKSMKCLK
jgi:hypothetical protein